MEKTRELKVPFFNNEKTIILVDYVNAQYISSVYNDLVKTIIDKIEQKIDNNIIKSIKYV